MKIVITGSLGHIGKPLTKELTEKGHAVTVISSKAEKQADIESLGATAAIGSLQDADFLTDILTGADSLFAMVPPNFAEMDQMAYYKRIGSNYAKAISQSGIKRVVYLSSYGADLDKGTGFILGAHYVEEILNQLHGIALTHLRPGYFYYNLYNFTAMIKEAGIIGTNFGGNDKMVLVAPVDIADVAAEELATLTGPPIHYVASDERTASEVAQVLGAAIGKPGLQWLTFTDEQTQSGMEQHGVPAPIAALFVELGGSLHSGALLLDYALHNPPVTGKVKLEDFAKEFAAAYQKD